MYLHYCFWNFKAPGGISGVPRLSYDNLSASTNSRKTVAGVFSQLLRPKTWDFVDLKQSGPCRDIEIRAGPRFRERLVEGEVLKEGKLEDS